MLLIASVVAAASGVGEPVRPEARSGFEIRIGERLEIVPLPIEQAPRVPSWAPHGVLTEHALDARADPALEGVLAAVVAQSLDDVSHHLPAPVRGQFAVWIFDRVPYAAKTLDADTVVLARRVVHDEQYRTQLPCVLAHELHHLALIRAGFDQLAHTPEEMVLAGLMLEGIPTWMCVSTGRFPEMAARMDERSLATAFAELRGVLDTRANGSLGVAGVFREHKPGYEVGAWMVARIEQTFGRERWLNLLREPLVDVPRRFLEAYLATAPPPELLL